MKIIIPVLLSTIVFCEKEYFQQDVAYDINVQLDDENHTLSAFEKITYTNNSPDTLQFIWFHLWPNAYKNDSSALAHQFLRLGSTRFKYTKEKDRGYIDSLDFSVDSVNAKWDYHPEWIDVAKVTLPKPLLPKGTVTIETPFFVKLPKVISRLGHTGKHYEITQWYPKPAVYDKDGWHPMPYLNMGEFYSEFGSFDVKITLPRNYRIMATGDLVNGETELAWLDSLASIGDSLKTLDKKGFKEAIKKLRKESKKAKKKKKDTDAESEDSVIVKTVHFRQDKVHDFAWFADPYWIVQKGKLWLEDSTRQVTLWSMYLPKNAKLWKSSIEYLHDAGFWYSMFYGDYPYNHITAVDGDMSAGGGMEYPNITVISRAGSKGLLEYVIMHEVGHNWFYGILGNNERDHTWMDEGLNEYTNIRYWEKKYTDRNNQFLLQDFVQNKLGVGKNFDIHSFHYLSFAGIGKSKDAQPLNISANDNFNNSNYGQNYMRTAVMMRFLQHYIGEEKMDEIMQDFYETWKFRHPQPDDLKYFFDKHVNEDVNWFFENVFEKTSYIDFGISKKGNMFWLTNFGTFNVPVEISFYDQSGEEISRSWISINEQITQLDAPPNSASATIDPDQYMPDVDRTNNATRRGIKTHFIFDKPSYYDRDIYVVPWLFSYNTYNGFTPGLVLWNGFLPGYDKRSVGLTLTYDFKNNKPVGGLLLSKGFDQIPFFHSGSWSLNIGTNAGRSGLHLGFNGTMKKPLSKSPISKVDADVFYHNLNSDALDPELYNSGEFVVASIKLEKRWRPSIFKSYSIGSRIKMGNGFVKGSLNSGFTYRASKKIKTSLFAGVGSFFLSDNIPLQYRYYLSGTVDPDFEQLVIDRMGGGGSDFKVLHNTYYGSGMRGIVVDNPTLSTDKMFWRIKIDQTLPYIPLNVFLDAAGSPGFETPQYAAAGIMLGPIIIPLYQSWETESTIPKDLDWFRNRIRLMLTIPNITIGR